MNLTDAERTELAGILRTVAAWQLPAGERAIPALSTWADRLDATVATDHADDGGAS